MTDLAFLLMLAAWSWGVGRCVLSKSSPASVHLAGDVALALPLGLGILALGVVVLAEVRCLNRAGLLAVFGTGCPLVLASFREVIRSNSLTFRSGNAEIVAERAAPNCVDRIFDLCLVLTLLGTLLTALAPVTDGDALCYHLQVPKVFLIRGSAYFEPDLHETVYPLVTEMLYAVGLALRGPVACRLVQWLFGVVFALNVTALARPILGSRARWAGTVALLVPAVSNGMGAPLNDVALAAFGTAALFAWTGWQARPTLGAATLTGVMAGLAMGVKYPALLWTGLLGMAMVAITVRRGIQQGGICESKYQIANSKYQIANDGDQTADLRALSRSRLFAICDLRSAILSSRRVWLKALQHTAVFAAAALLVGGVWYLRAFVHTGNPVFPFFRHTFGAGIDEVLDPIKRPMAVTPWNLLTAFGPMTLEPDRFDSVSHQFGPAFLLFLPGLLILKPPRRVVAIGALGWIFLTVCLTQRQSMRFLLIAVGPLAVAVAWTIQAWSARRTMPARILVGLALAMLVSEAGLALARARHGIGVVLGCESAESYLSRREPTYRVGQWIEGHLPESARLVGQDYRAFYLPRPYAMELAHRRRTGLASRGEAAEQIVARLHERGFSHLMLCPPIPENAVEFDPTLSRRLAPWLEQRAPLFDEKIKDADGVVRRYMIYDLSPGGELAEQGRVRR
jgi:hypothetical protein